MFSRLTLLALGAFALVVAGAACTQRPRAEWDTDRNALIIRATFCCGFVPQTVAANYIPDAQVWSDGRILWVETNTDGGRRVLEGHLTFEQMTALTQRIVDEGFFGWDDLYRDAYVTDLATQCLAVNLASRSKTECEYYQGAPQAFHDLYADIVVGAAGADYVPTTGYLTAYPQDYSGQAAAPVIAQWPSEAAGFALDEATGGRWVDGAALALAWQVVNTRDWGGLVQDGEAYYALALQIPSVSQSEPPGPMPAPVITSTAPATRAPSEIYYPPPATLELTPPPMEPYPASLATTVIVGRPRP